MTKADFTAGDRIYYTGDMANASGWFTVTRVGGPRDVELKECPGGDGRTINTPALMIGDLYKGHCNPRFVTAKAYAAYYEALRVLQSNPL